ncbi:MAG: HAMP domain-containing histidine kinase [Planctomycetes bacterium]|nr:HAMP domain-containing histidine kinase [Planctomycetota bacterium]
MARDTNTSRLEPWIELLCAAGDEHVRDRLLVECVLSLRCARAAALWRPLTTAVGVEWRERLARGPADSLPRRAQFDALRRGELSQTSIPGVRVFTADSVALALGGVTCEDDELDPVAALLHVFALVGCASDTGAPRAPLPAARNTQPSVDSDEDRRLRHDLANVLTSLRATEDMLKNFSVGLSGDETAHFRAVVEHECARAGELLAGAFLPRALPQRAPTEGGSCAVLAVLTRVLDAEHALNTHAGITVETLIDPSTRDARVPLSEADLSRCLQNLLVNAREALAGRAGSRVWITLEHLYFGATHSALRLIVEDDGVGFPAWPLERLFEAGSTTKEAGSDGQGLSIVRGLIEQSGGRIRAYRRASGGAAFEMTWPPSS